MKTAKRYAALAVFHFPVIASALTPAGKAQRTVNRALPQRSGSSFSPALLAACNRGVAPISKVGDCFVGIRPMPRWEKTYLLPKGYVRENSNCMLWLQQKKANFSTVISGSHGQGKAALFTNKRSSLTQYETHLPERPCTL